MTPPYPANAGVFVRQDVFLVATGLWSLVHGITSMRIAIPQFPFVGADALFDHVLDTYARGLGAPLAFGAQH